MFSSVSSAIGWLVVALYEGAITLPFLLVPLAVIGGVAVLFVSAAMPVRTPCACHQCNVLRRAKRPTLH